MATNLGRLVNLLSVSFIAMAISTACSPNYSSAPSPAAPVPSAPPAKTESPTDTTAPTDHVSRTRVQHTVDKHGTPTTVTTTVTATDTTDTTDSGTDVGNDSGSGSGAACDPHWAEMLKANDKNGFSVYDHLSDKSGFDFFLRCDEVDGDVFTALHESVHTIDTDAFAYFLDSGEKVPWADDIKTNPMIIKDAPEVADSYYRTPYLTDAASASAQGIQGLLEELNAYSRELLSVVRLAPKITREAGKQESFRDGVTNIMFFIKLYLNRINGTPDWSALTSAKNVTAFGKVWTQAEESLAQGCRVSGIGLEDQKWLACLLGSSDQMAGLSAMLGRAPQLPGKCLE